jgi:DNA-directed RNA polymerase specialized sigma24 family protein
LVGRRTIRGSLRRRVGVGRMNGRSRELASQRADRAGLVARGHGASPRGSVEGLVLDAYLKHAAPLARYLEAMVRERCVAEDLAQEAFLRLAGEVAMGRVPDNVPAWLFRVGANLVVSRGRHIAVVTRVSGQLPVVGAIPSPEGTILAMERAREVKAVLATLSSDHRTALLMNANGYGGPEIAARLGRTPLATRALLCRARSRMRSRLLAAGVEM